MNNKPTFNMKDLSNNVASTFGFTGKQAAAVTKHVFDKIKDEILAGNQVRLHHFGTLEARRRQAGVARNPQTGERLTVPARRVLKLTVATSLRSELSKA